MSDEDLKEHNDPTENASDAESDATHDRDDLLVDRLSSVQESDVDALFESPPGNDDPPGKDCCAIQRVVGFDAGVDSMPCSPPDSLAVESGRQIYYEDSQGRPVMAEGWLVDEKAKRELSAQRALNEEAPGFDASHLIASMYGGSGWRQNLVPLDAEVNRQTMLEFENSARKEMRNGTEVYVQTYARYSDASRYPSEIEMRTYHRDGKDGQLKLLDQIRITGDGVERMQ